MRPKLEPQASCDSGISSDYEESSSSDVENISSKVPAIELPLNRNWNFYFLSNCKDWEERIKKISTISTVQQFWSVYNHVKLPTHISVGCDLMLFQSDIEP